MATLSSGPDRPDSETPIERRYADGPMVAGQVTDESWTTPVDSIIDENHCKQNSELIQVIGILSWYRPISYTASTCIMIYEPRHVVFETSKGSDHHAHTRSLIRVFASRLNIL